jgi:hypothetical protein
MVCSPRDQVPAGGSPEWRISKLRHVLFALQYQRPRLAPVLKMQHWPIGLENRDFGLE